MESVSPQKRASFCLWALGLPPVHVERTFIGVRVDHALEGGLNVSSQGCLGPTPLFVSVGFDQIVFLIKLVRLTSKKNG